MNDPIRLTPKPKVSDEIRKSVVDDLLSALKDAENGDIEASIIILKRCDGYWVDYRSGVEGFPEAIGRLEIIKQAWIATYLKEPAA